MSAMAAQFCAGQTENAAKKYAALNEAGASTTRLLNTIS
jgi:hypothetical protein